MDRRLGAIALSNTLLGQPATLLCQPARLDMLTGAMQYAERRRNMPTGASLVICQFGGERKPRTLKILAVRSGITMSRRERPGRRKKEQRESHGKFHDVSPI